ncbi:MAG TPA: hypothetical protein VII84_00400, partial [Acidimicrobiales bacterium]
AALIGPGQEEQPLAQLPTGLNQSSPCDGVNLAGDRKAACALKCLDGHSGTIAEVVNWVRNKCEAEGAQTLVEIAHANAGGATLQGVEVQGLV